MPLVLDGTNGVSGVDGTASNPAIEGTDSNTGIFYPAADTVAIGTGGTERLRVDSSGNVGIGTSSPAVKLNVSTSAAGIAEPVWLNNSQAVGAGVGSRLVFTGTTSNNGLAAIDGAFAGATTADGGYMVFNTRAVTSGALTERMRIDSSGNVGIGTTSPNAKLDIVATTNTIRLGRSTSSYATIDSNSNAGSLNLNADVGNTASGGSMTFTFAGTERARINSAGYSKFSDNGTYLGSTNTFHEFRQSANDVALIVHGTNTSQTDNVMYVRASRNTTNNTFYAFGYYNDAAAAYKMRVADSGTITNTTGTYTTISDIKLKQDIVDASSQWDDIKALRIVKYRLKEYVQNDPDSKPFLGLIAQEVEQVCPSLVEEQEDEVMDEDGKLVKNGEVTKGVKTSILYMKAVKALQEAMSRIEQLEAKVAALENA